MKAVVYLTSNTGVMLDCDLSAHNVGKGRRAELGPRVQHVQNTAAELQKLVNYVLL